MDSDQQESSFVEDMSEDDGDWEEVAVPLAPLTNEVASVAAPYEPYADLNPNETLIPGASNVNIEITIQTKDDSGEPKCVDELFSPLSGLTLR
jgi:hypothetical protein